MTSAHISLRQAERCCTSHRWDLAGRLFREAIEDDPSPVNHFAYGSFLAERQQYHAAIVQLIKGLDGAQAARNLELQAGLFGTLAAVYRELGEFDLARRFQRQVLSLRQSAGADELLAWGTDALLAGKELLAGELCQRALMMAENAVDLGQQSDICGMLGVISARSGKLRRAMWYLIRAARGHRHVGDDRSLAADYQNLAEVSGLMDRRIWQRQFFSAARDHFERAGMPVSQARCETRFREEERFLVDWTAVAARN